MAGWPESLSVVKSCGILESLIFNQSSLNLNHFLRLFATGEPWHCVYRYQHRNCLWLT